MKKIAIIGTVGVPAKYGGFESLAENLIGTLKSKDIKYTIYCSEKAYNEKLREYKGAKLEYISFEANGAQSVIYDIISLIKASRKHEIILVLGVSGCCFLPIFRLFARKKKLVINIDGLEHRREKWGKWARLFLKFSEKMAVKYADVIIADNKGIQDYVTREYDKDSILIAYGGDHALANTMSGEEEQKILKKYDYIKNKKCINILLVNKNVLSTTLLVDKIAKNIFECNYIVIDMNELKEFKYELFESIRINPFSIVFIKNVDKCNRRVFNIIKDSIDKGMIGDINITKCIFFMSVSSISSNIGFDDKVICKEGFNKFTKIINYN